MPFEDDVIEVITPERVELNFPIAGLGSRFYAAFIDFLIVLLIDISLVILMSLLHYLIAGGNFYISSSISGLTLTLIFAVDFLYYIYLEYKNNGQTIGKRCMRIRTIRLNGLPVDFTSAVIRNLIRPIDLLLFGMAIGFVVIFMSKFSQRPGDYVAGTVVIHDQNVTLEHLTKYLKKPAKKKSTINSEGLFRKLSDDDAQLIELFINRAKDLNIESRRQLAQKIASRIRQKINADPDEYGGNENLIRAAREALKKRERGNW